MIPLTQSTFMATSSPFHVQYHDSLLSQKELTACDSVLDQGFPYMKQIFTINSVREVFIGSSNSHIHDDIEFLVKRSRIISSSPDVLKYFREFSFSPEAFLSEIYFQNSVGIIIYVSVKLIFVPIQSKCVEIISKSALRQ